MTTAVFTVVYEFKETWMDVQWDLCDTLFWFYFIIRLVTFAETSLMKKSHEILSDKKQFEVTVSDPTFEIGTF